VKPRTYKLTYGKQSILVAPERPMSFITFLRGYVVKNIELVDPENNKFERRDLTSISMTDGPEEPDYLITMNGDLLEP
jgi:hypothetical protein